MKVSSAAIATVATLVEMNPFAEGKDVSATKHERVAGRRTQAINRQQAWAEKNQQKVVKDEMTALMMQPRSIMNKGREKTTRNNKKRCDPDAGILACKPGRECVLDEKTPIDGALPGVCVKENGDLTVEMAQPDPTPLTLGVEVSVGSLDKGDTASFSLDLPAGTSANCYLSGPTPDADLYAIIDGNRVCASLNDYSSYEACFALGRYYYTDDFTLELQVNNYEPCGLVTDLTLVCYAVTQLTPGVEYQLEPLEQRMAVYFTFPVEEGELIDCTLTGDTPDAELYAYFGQEQVCYYELDTSNEQCLNLQTPPGFSSLFLTVFNSARNGAPLTDLTLVCGELEEPEEPEEPVGKKGISGMSLGPVGKKGHMTFQGGKKG